MSGTGSMMIRNLRKPTDYAKAVQTQDELLRIAIANDMNVAEARKLVQQGEVLMPTPQDLKSPAELQQDYAFQEKTAIENLLQLFRYNEIGQIISNLSPDEIFVLNSSFPSIKQDFTTRFNPKLITPTFFIEYLRRFALELNASKGVTTNLAFITNKFNDLTDNIEDMKANLPTREQFFQLSRNLEKAFNDLPEYIVTPVIQRIVELQRVLPSRDYLNKLTQSNNDVLKFEILAEIQDLTENLPTRDQLGMLIEDTNSGKLSQQEGFSKLQDMVSEVNMSQIEALQNLTGELSETGKLGKRQTLVETASVKLDIPYVPTLSVGQVVQAGGKKGKIAVYIVYDNENSDELSAAGLKKIYNGNPQFKSFYDSQIGIPKKEPSIKELRQYILGVSKAPPSNISDVTRTTLETSGSGIAKNGRVLTKIKIGKGVEYEAEPTYRQLGKYVVNMPQLKNRDILNVKFRSLGRIPQLKPIPISEVTKEFILELLDTGKASHRIYDQIPIEERQYFERVATGAGIINNLKLKRTLTEEDIKDNERFALLRGEYVAGNNSSTLLKELRKLVVKFMNSGKITKTDGTNLLIELSV
jgi:hypothetical protein